MVPSTLFKDEVGNIDPFSNLCLLILFRWFIYLKLIVPLSKWRMGGFLGRRSYLIGVSSVRPTSSDMTYDSIYRSRGETLTP